MKIVNDEDGVVERGVGVCGAGRRGGHGAVEVGSMGVRCGQKRVEEVERRQKLVTYSCTTSGALVEAGKGEVGGR
jgi:hypothetical protein